MCYQGPPKGIAEGLAMYSSRLEGITINGSNQGK